MDPMETYLRATPTSRVLFERAQRILPYGITRDPVWREPYPLYVAHGVGKQLVDVDGNPYLDWWNNATSLALGHADPRVVAAVQTAALDGLSFASPTRHELEHGERILARLPGAERIRFTNSGSEAVMLAVQMGRAASGRPGLVKFEGAYHGSYDPIAATVTTNDATLRSLAPGSPAAEGTGISRHGLVDTRVVPWNDLPSLEALLAHEADQLGAILVEPVANKQGVLTPSPGYLSGLRELADRYRMVLIFDEVISFRVSAAGAQGLYGVEPDLTTLGKVIGGGMPIGAVAGRWEVMRHLRHGSPDGVVHMGTFNANPISMAAGAATLDALDAAAYEHLANLGEFARERVRAAIAAAGVPWQVTGVASMFKIHLQDRPILRYRDTLPRPKQQELELVTRLLLAGHVLPYNAAAAVTLPMQLEDASALAEAVFDAAVAMRRSGSAASADSGQPSAPAVVAEPTERGASVVGRS